MLSYAHECPYMPVMYKVYQKYVKGLSKAKLNAYEVEMMSREFEVYSEDDHYVILGNVQIRAPTPAERDRFNELYHIDPTTQQALENLYDIDPALALEEFFAIAGGNTKFVEGQFDAQVVRG